MARRKKAFSGQTSDVDLRLMRVFKTVIECGGLSAAQAELGVSRSTISIQLSDLETRLGVRLCHRGRSGFSLTQQGQQVLTYIDRLLTAVDDFGANVSSVNDRMVGKIEIGMIDYTVSDDNNPLMSAIKHYREKEPGVTISLMTGTPNEIERGVIDGTLHVGIVPDYHRLPGLRYNYLYHEPIGLFCGGEHPLAQEIAAGAELTAEEVYEHKLVFRGYYESDALRGIKERFPVGCTVYQTEAVLAFVQAGVYLGFFPVHCVDAMRGTIYEVLPEVFGYTSPICAISRSDRRQSVILQDFLGLLCTEK